jgi:putative transposase
VWSWSLPGWSGELDGHAGVSVRAGPDSASGGCSSAALWCRAGGVQLGLARVTANLGQRQGDASYGIAAEDLAPSLLWSMYALRQAWNRVKDQVAPWWAECSKEAYAGGLDQLARGVKNWSESGSGTRGGPRMGFARFKSKRRSGLSCRFPTGPIRVDPDRQHVTLPVLGTSRRTSRPAHSPAASTTARRGSGPRRCGTRPGAGSCRSPSTSSGPNPPRPGRTRPGVDNPTHLGSALRKLRRACRTGSRRRGPDRRSGQAPANRWRTANKTRHRVQYRATRVRRDAIHTLTTGLAGEYGTIVVEDLPVAGMLRNRRPARAIADAGFGEIRRPLRSSTKPRWGGGRLEVADRWFPSSKTCSNCPAVKPKLSLRVRTFRCEHCGVVLDRDVNASLTLPALVTRHVAGSGSETGNGRGADRKTEPSSAGGREASTPAPGGPRPDRTGTFDQQWANHGDSRETPVNGVVGGHLLPAGACRRATSRHGRHRPRRCGIRCRRRRASRPPGRNRRARQDHAPRAGPLTPRHGKGRCTRGCELFGGL